MYTLASIVAVRLRRAGLHAALAPNNPLPGSGAAGLLALLLR